MNTIEFKSAFYLKLGEKGMYEVDLKEGDRARIGWKNIELKDIINKNWQSIKAVIEKDFKDRNKKSGATNDYKALKTFCDATQDDVFITFANSKLYWCTLKNDVVYEDKVSKFRLTLNKWSSQDIFGKELLINEISGKITKTIGFQATICRIYEIEILHRIINGEVNPIAIEIDIKKKELTELLLYAIGELHWKDFEVLTDIMFQKSGWQRVSMLGESMKFTDIELEDPITKDKYQVQVKANAGISEFEDYARAFNAENFRKLFFVVFQPEKSLKSYKNTFPNVVLLTDISLCRMIIDLGLLNWVLKRVN